MTYDDFMRDPYILGFGPNTFLFYHPISPDT